MDFFTSHACQSGKFCGNCRAKTVMGAKWRASLLLVYPELKENEFACPFGVAWDDGVQPSRNVPAPAVKPDPNAKPPITAAKVASFVEAMLTAPAVSKEVEAQRQAICAKCDKRKLDKKGSPFCGLCGCSVAVDGWKLMHLTHYEENLPKWGCKHPLRQFKHKTTNQEYGWPLPVQGEPK